MLTCLKQNICFGYNTLYLWQEPTIKLTKTIKTLYWIWQQKQICNQKPLRHEMTITGLEASSNLSQ